jgi:hypothetical protein
VKLARQLVTAWFQTLVDKDWTELQTFMSPAFQIVRANGSRATKSEYLASKPDEQSFQLSRMFATRSGSVLVANYVVKEKAVIDGVPYSTDPAPRLTVFTRSDKSAPWQILSTANFNTVPCSDSTTTGAPVLLADSASDASAADVARGTSLVNGWTSALLTGDRREGPHHGHLQHVGRHAEQQWPDGCSSSRNGDFREERQDGDVAAGGPSAHAVLRLPDEPLSGKTAMTT